MPDILAQALSLPGLGWLTAAIVAAGLVRGFSGFGSAMIIMPAASSVLDPFAALAFLVVVEFWGPLPNLRAALRDGHRGEALRLLIGAAIGLPLGLWALSMLSPEVFGWTVSVVVLILLGLVISGWRYTGTLGPAAITGLGSLGGFLGGVAGIPGPPVIMLYMASARAISVIRANFLLYLLGIDVLMLGLFIALDLLDATAVVVALILVPLYMISNIVGARLFDPERDRVFRAVAYAVIAVSALLGLPIWE
ncbi:sulfite exporter TauE/SafE family protein [Aestuariivita sp.]|jgi:uncharacterized membrane protein YfcA|uniref:sulfite exporter TauE/SafE family protein n=1 Tax=Aestuariivita sp. TaxID=1872407 RepID=UPI002171E119|nr:sulfite exporter TauE/SafE family protein [Aestuariivita sp.]MCE8009579.1 sulfite exporter TauE/SafE family protein [Aestuariivita sp.]